MLKKLKDRDVIIGKIDAAIAFLGDLAEEFEKRSTPRASVEPKEARKPRALKLDRHQKEISEMIALGAPMAYIGRKYGVAQITVSKFVKARGLRDQKARAA